MAGLLEGKTACVVGGASAVGEGIVRVFLDEGAARVVVPAGSSEELADLRARLTGAAGERLETVEADAGEPAGAAKLREFLLASGAPLDVAVVSIDSSWKGPRLLDLPLEEWRRATASLTAHVVVAQTLLPLLENRAGATCLFLNTGAALAAVPNAAPVSIASAAQLMLKNALVAEAHEGSAVRILSLVIAAPVLSRDREEGEPNWLSAEDAGRYAAWLCSPAAAEMHGRNVVLRSRDDLPRGT